MYPGVSTETYQNLDAPVGRLYFAGQLIWGMIIAFKGCVYILDHYPERYYQRRFERRDEQIQRWYY